MEFFLNFKMPFLKRHMRDDVSMGGLFDPNNNSPTKQEFKAKNWLFKAPRTVGKAEASPGLLFVFDPGKGQLG